MKNSQLISLFVIVLVNERNTNSMCLVLIEGLYSGMCAVPENNNKGGRGVSVLHEGDTH